MLLLPCEVAFRVAETPEAPNEIVVNPNATLDWQLALRRSRKTDLARDMLQMLLDFLPEVRNKVEEQLVEKTRKASGLI